MHGTYTFVLKERNGAQKLFCLIFPLHVNTCTSNNIKSLISVGNIECAGQKLTLCYLHLIFISGNIIIIAGQFHHFQNIVVMSISTVGG